MFEREESIRERFRPEEPQTRRAPRHVKPLGRAIFDRMSDDVDSAMTILVDAITNLQPEEESNTVELRSAYTI